MKKYILLITIALSASLSSCQNITISDFSPNDIGNIVSFLFLSDGEEPETTSEAFELTTDITEPITPSTQVAVEIPTISSQEIGAEEIEEIESRENVPEAPETEVVTEAITENPIITTEASAPATSPDAQPTVRTDSVFEDAPEIFKRVRFPENLKMTAALKQALRKLDSFSIKNFNNTEFFIATTNAMLFTPQLGGGDLSDIRNYRSRLVQTVCRVEIRAIPREAENLAAEMEREVNAGNYFSDILCVPLSVQSQLIEKGLLINLKKIPFINLGAEYYNQSAIEAATINNNTYTLVSDMFFDPSDMYAMFYNKDLIEKYNLENPMDLYENNAWTYDSIFEFNRSLSAAAADVNGDYALGFNKENNDILNGLFTASGNRYFDTHDYDYPILNFNNEQTQRLIDALTNIFSQPELNFLDSNEEVQREIFTQGNMLFSVSTLDIIPSISEIHFNWGILPVPRLDGGEVRSFVSKDSLSLSVLKGTPNTEICGIVTEALSISSHKIFQESYIREQLMYNLRDVESARVLTDILNNVTYNQYNIYGTIDSIYGATTGVLKEAANGRGEFGSLYENSTDKLNDYFKNSQAFYRN